MAVAMVIVQDFCRLCNENSGIINIFDTAHLPGDILLFTGVLVCPEDKLPQTICSKCLDIISNIKELKQLAQTNAKYLQSLLKDSCYEEKYEDSKLNISLVDDLYTNQNDFPTKMKEKLIFETSIEEEASYNCDINETVIIPKTVKYKDVATNTILCNFSEKDSIMNSASAGVEFRKKLKDCLKITHDCDICSKEFFSPKKLAVHMRQHYRTFKCSMYACQKSFPTKNDLRRHMRTHTGEKPYKCHFCDRSFAQKSSVRSHINSIHAKSKSSAGIITTNVLSDNSTASPRKKKNDHQQNIFGAPKT